MSKGETETFREVYLFEMTIMVLVALKGSGLRLGGWSAKYLPLVNAVVELAVVLTEAGKSVPI